MENLNNPEIVNRGYVFHREIKEDFTKGDYFKIFLREKNQDKYSIIFEIPSQERNLDDFTIFKSFLVRKFGEEILSKNTNEIFEKLRSIAVKIEN